MRRIEKVEEMSIGQLYMYKKAYSDRLNKGYCIKLEKDKATFTGTNRSWDEDTVRLSPKYSYSDTVYEYNSGIYRKYQKLLEQQEKEREDLLSGKPVVVTAISKEKWYKRFLRRKKNGTRP